MSDITDYKALCFELAEAFLDLKDSWQGETGLDIGEDDIARAAGAVALRVIQQIAPNHPELKLLALNLEPDA